MSRLREQAYLLLAQVEQQPELLQDAGAAQRFLATVAARSDARVLLLSQDGILLGSTHPQDRARMGTRFLTPSVERALGGAPTEGNEPGLVTEVAFVTLPIRQNSVTQGVLRLSYEVTDVQDRLDRLRWLILGGTGVILVLALGLGLGLAVTITRPLSRLVQHAQEIAAGNYQTRVAAQRQDEIGMLAVAFNQMAVKLEESEAARQHQLAAVVHELTRPLASMRAAVEALQGGALADAEVGASLLSGTATEIERLERLLGTLQGLDRRLLQPLQLQRAPLSLDRIVRASVTAFEPLATHLGIILTVDLPADLPTVSADEDRLIQVITNLLDNALKFTPRGGRILVWAEEQPDEVFVSVADSGVDITPEELPHLFQQFYQGAESRPPETRGMGLGLTLSHEIITAHGGQIWVESTPGHGTRFTFSLPKHL